VILDGLLGGARQRAQLLDVDIVGGGGGGLGQAGGRSGVVALIILKAPKAFITLGNCFSIS